MNDKINILVTAIGSMSADTVLHSLKGIGNVNTFACDINKGKYLVLARQFEKNYQIPKATAETFIDELLDICVKNNIHIVFPLTDPEVDRLTEAELEFRKHGISIATPGLETVRLCRDKMEFYTRLKSTPGIRLIPTFDNSEILAEDPTFPLIAKPAKGRSSEGLFKVNDMELLTYLTKNAQNYVFQHFIVGSIFTVDVVRDFEGNLFTLARQELLRTSNGAGLTVEVQENAALHEAVGIICEALNIVGVINIEFIFDGVDYYLMDINPRFSAGIGFSKAAGYDFVKQCLRVFTGEGIETDTLITPGIYAKHYTDYKIG